MWRSYWEDMSAGARARTLLTWVLTGLAVGAVGALTDHRSAWSALIGCAIFTTVMLIVTPVLGGADRQDRP